jgi:hypothetical protein
MIAYEEWVQFQSANIAEQWAANAKLAAAAPDLLAALKRFAENDHPCKGGNLCDHCAALAAIEKAEGAVKGV